MARALTRRSLLATAAILPAITTRNSILLGAPTLLNSDDPVELAREHKRLHYSAAYCPPAEIQDQPRIQAIEKAFRDNNVVIAEVGAWKNMLDQARQPGARTSPMSPSIVPSPKPSAPAAASTSPTPTTKPSGTAPTLRTSPKNSSTPQSKTAAKSSTPSPQNALNLLLR